MDGLREIKANKTICPSIGGVAVALSLRMDQSNPPRLTRITMSPKDPDPKKVPPRRHIYLQYNIARRRRRRLVLGQIPITVLSNEQCC